LFVAFMRGRTIPETRRTWTASKVPETSALLRINRFVVNPTMGIDVSWEAPAGRASEQAQSLSIMVARREGELVVVSYDLSPGKADP